MAGDGARSLGEVMAENERLSLEVCKLQEELARKELANSGLPASPPPLLWRGCARMPSGVVRPHVVSKGRKVYVGGGNTGRMESTRTVFEYDSIANSWSNLPITAYYTFSLAIINDKVVVIGGINVLSTLASDKLASFDEKMKKWSHTLPPMPTKRCATSAVATKTHLVVVGGISVNNQNYLSTVEILNISANVWSKAAPLPAPVTFMSMTICHETERIYLLGGLTNSGAIKSVYSCLLVDLIASNDKKEGNTVKTQEGVSATDSGPWGVIADCPYFRSGCIAVNGQLVIASGLTGTDETTTTIHCFDPEAKLWSVLGEMPAARSSCSLALISDDQLMVAGGYVQPRNWMGSLTRDVMATVNFKVPR